MARLKSSRTFPLNGSFSLSSIDSVSYTTFWTSPGRSPPRFIPSPSRVPLLRKNVAVVLILLLSLIIWLIPPFRPHNAHPATVQTSILRPTSSFVQQEKDLPDPIQWLEDNSNNKWQVTRSLWGTSGTRGRPKAALITLVRNSELDGILQSMRQLEYRWNEKYQYPWVFFNDEPFSEEFKVCAVDELMPKVREADGTHAECNLKQHIFAMLL